MISLSLSDMLISLGVVIFVIGILLFLLHAFLTQHRETKLLHPITTTPVVPEWLQNSEDIYPGPQEARFRIQLRYLQRSREDAPKWKEVHLKKKLHAIDQVTKILEAQLGPLEEPLPANTCTISIPMENFTFASGGPSEFQPLGSLDLQGTFNYQMFGDHRIQVTRYVEGGVACVAGYCIFVKDPYEYSACLEEKVFENYLKI